jgi:hypothetical protein
MDLPLWNCHYCGTSINPRAGQSCQVIEKENGLTEGLQGFVKKDCYNIQINLKYDPNGIGLQVHLQGIQ